MNIVIENADVLKWSVAYKGPLFHALLCDPPYELGFMGKDWDASGIAFDKDTWKALTVHLYPGAFGMAFASARGWHRLAVAIEDAGLIIHPSIFGWSYGSGFPKATRIDTQVDEAVVAAWEGHRYGLQALKPALEPIIVFQKPYQGRPVDCITKTGAGALNIDGGRIKYEDGGTLASNPSLRESIAGGKGGNIISHEEDRRFTTPDNKGRWPANLILQHTPECVDGCSPNCPVRRMGEQSGESKSNIRHPSGGTILDPEIGWNQNSMIDTTIRGQSDQGTAARFFFQSDWMAERLDEADPVRYCAKASRRERDAGLERGFAKFAPTMGDCIGAVHHNENDATWKRNPHPAVKPIALMRYLATLLLPPSMYAPRRLLVPFAGVASEMIGAYQAEWEEITGIEMNPEYCDIGNARIAYWKGVGNQIKMDL